MGKKRKASLDIFRDVEKMESDHELALSPTLYWVKFCWEGKWAGDMVEARKRQIFEAKFWNKVPGPVGAVCRELRDAGIQWPACALDCRMVAPDVERRHLSNRAQRTRWAKKGIEELEGVWFELVTRRNRAQKRTWVINVCDAGKLP